MSTRGQGGENGDQTLSDPASDIGDPKGEERSDPKPGRGEESAREDVAIIEDVHLVEMLMGGWWRP